MRIAGAALIVHSTCRGNITANQAMVMPIRAIS